MEPENQPSREELKKSTDPQQSEMDLNYLGGVFQDSVGDSKGNQGEPDKPGASQTGGVADNNEKID
jgi:hypothetical protein